MPLKSWIFFSGFLRNCTNKLCSQLRGSFFIWFHFRSSMSNQVYYYITFLPTSHKTAHGLEFIKRVSQSDYFTLFHMEHSQLPQRVQLFKRARNSRGRTCSSRFLLLLLFIIFFNLPKQVISISLAISAINSLFLSRSLINSSSSFVFGTGQTANQQHIWTVWTVNLNLQANDILSIVQNNNKLI